jgi:hypothetical protein
MLNWRTVGQVIFCHVCRTPLKKSINQGLAEGSLGNAMGGGVWRSSVMGEGFPLYTKQGSNGLEPLV